MLTVDASVWVAAGNSFDTFAATSRQFFAVVAHQHVTLYVPSFAEVEIACAVARRRQNTEAGRRWAKFVMAQPRITIEPVDAALLDIAMHIGTQYLLRAGDALYVAVAAIHSAPLISWDAELIRRAGALTPADWLAANAR
jgi:predicted nucleic acid-binding protein